MATSNSTTPDSFDVPYRDPLLTRLGTLSSPWINFFRGLFERVVAFGGERSFQLVNNQIAAAPIDGMKINARAASFAIVEYCVQRITDSSSLIEGGAFQLTYNPTDQDWDLDVLSENKPSNAGIAFTVDSSGQVDYTTTNVSGTQTMSRIFFRMRTLAGKSTQYSSQGTR